MNILVIVPKWMKLYIETEAYIYSRHIEIRYCALIESDDFYKEVYN